MTEDEANSSTATTVVSRQHQHLVDLSQLTSHPDSPLSRGAARAAVDDAVDELTAAGDQLIRASAQVEQSVVAEELARRRAERDARERALQEREIALLAAVEEEERDWLRNNKNWMLSWRANVTSSVPNSKRCVCAAPRLTTSRRIESF